MDLTPREKQAYELRHSTDPLMTWREVGLAMGISMITARTHGTRAADKLVNPNRRSALYGSQDQQRMEYRDPDTAAEVIDALTDPMAGGVTAAAEKCGLPTGAISRLSERLQRDYQPVYEAVTRLKSDVLIKAFERNAIAALESITDDDYKKMSAYQKTLVAAISVDKFLLLEGRPTQNINLTVEDRRSVTELIGEIHRIAETRGYMKEVNPATNIARFVDREDAPVEVLLRDSSKQYMPRIDSEED